MAEHPTLREEWIAAPYMQAIEQKARLDWIRNTVAAAAEGNPVALEILAEHEAEDDGCCQTCWIDDVSRHDAPCMVVQAVARMLGLTLPEGVNGWPHL